MNIPQEAKQKWQSLQQHGDVQKISDGSEYSRDTISKALNGDVCSIEVFSVIQDFYNKRQQEINASVNPQQFQA